jgi:hypothetical protein
MVVRDFDFVGITVLPAKTHAVLLIEPDTVLAGPITTEPFEPVPRRNLQLLQSPDPVQLVQLSAGNRPKLSA